MGPAPRYTAAILASNPGARNGLYWITIPGVGARQLYCEMEGSETASGVWAAGGWMLVLRGVGTDDVKYGDAKWTSSEDEGDVDLLLAGDYGSFAKSVAFAAFDQASRILVKAGSFSGRNADGTYRSFEFTFDGVGTPQNLMFTTDRAMSWNSTYALWRSTFGQDRSTNPSFHRAGSTANQDVGQDRTIKGCGQAMMFGFNARDGGNDVNSGLGTHGSYCGGSGGAGFAGGSWMGNGGSAQIWMR